MATSTFLVLMGILKDEPSLTGRNLEDRLLYKFSAATIANTSLTTTDPMIVALGASAPADRFQHWGIYLETAAEERIGTTMTISGSTATINFIGGGNATNQAGATNVWLVRTGKWSEIRNAASTVLEYIPVEALVPLAHGPDDWHMQANNTTSWTGTNATVAKQTTAAEVLMGLRSTSLTLTSAAGYMTSTTVRMGQGESGTMHVIAKADTGTGIARALDNGGNTIESVSFTQEQWIYIRKAFTLGSTDEGSAIRILGTDNLDQIDVNMAWLVNRSENEYPLPSWLDHRFKLKDIIVRHYNKAGSESDTWLARSYHEERLVEGEDYHFSDYAADVTPTRVTVNPYFRDDPIFLQIECPASSPYGVDQLFTSDSSTTLVPPHLIIAGLKAWVGAQYGALFPRAESEGNREFKARLRNRRTQRTPLPGWYGPTGGVSI